MRASLVDAIPMTDAQFGLLTSVFSGLRLVESVGGYLRTGSAAAGWCWQPVRVVGHHLADGHAQTFNQLLLARRAWGVSEACYLPAALG